MQEQKRWQKKKTYTFKNGSKSRKLFFQPCLIIFDFGSYFQRFFLFSQSSANAKIILWLLMWHHLVTHLFVICGCLWNFRCATYFSSCASHIGGGSRAVGEIIEACCLLLEATDLKFGNPRDSGTQRRAWMGCAKIARSCSPVSASLAIPVSGEQEWMTDSLIHWVNDDKLKTNF